MTAGFTRRVPRACRARFRCRSLLGQRRADPCRDIDALDRAHHFFFVASDRRAAAARRPRRPPPGIRVREGNAREGGLRLARPGRRPRLPRQSSSSAQSPAPGSKLVATGGRPYDRASPAGATSNYAQEGTPEGTSPYARRSGSPVRSQAGAPAKKAAEVADGCRAGREGQGDDDRRHRRKPG